MLTFNSQLSILNSSYMKQKIGFLAVLTLLWSVFYSCSTDVPINAPYKDIYVVYGVLNATDSIQYIRVSKAFLVNQDAIEYAKTYDPSVKGLKVVLKGFGKTYTATQIDNVPLKGEGAFYPFTTLYKIETKGTNALVTGRRYDLTISKLEDDSLQLTAHTFIPLRPDITYPDYAPGPGNTKSIRQMPLQGEVEMTWKAPTSAGAAYGFEVRAFLYHETNGIADTATYVSNLVLNGTGQRCVPSASSMCYKFQAKEIIRVFRNQMNDASAIYTYDDSPKSGLVADLPRSLRYEVTSIDTALTKYLRVNSPSYTDFNTVKPEYTNLTGTKDVYGVFGSINKASAYTIMDDCPEYLLRLNNTPLPGTTQACQW